MSEPGVEYAAGGRADSAAVRSLAQFLGITEDRAAGLLADPAAYRGRIRSRRPLSAAEARRILSARRDGP